MVRANAYLDLIADFPDKVDAASAYYYLGRSYAETGRWDLAFEAYRQFLTYPDAQIPGVPTARNDILGQVAFYDSPKDWTMPTLESLVTAVRTAIVQGNRTHF
jgi:tetratricopeptide (TPR) repeat protein